MQLLLDFVISFIQQNRQSIQSSLGQQPLDVPVSEETLAGFTLTKFLISCCNEQCSGKLKNEVEQCKLLVEYLAPV